MLVSLVVDTDSAKDNNAIANKVNKYLKDNKISTKILNTVSDGKGRTVVLAVDGLDVMDATTYASAIEKTVDFISWVESAWEEIGEQLFKGKKPRLSRSNLRMASQLSISMIGVKRYIIMFYSDMALF
jgi:hypothetical protein